MGNAGQHGSSSPTDSALASTTQSITQLYLQEAQCSHIDVCWKDLPEELGPFKEHIADVEYLKDPDPVGIAEMEVSHDASSLCVPNVASIEVRKHIKEAHDRQTFSCRTAECGQGRLPKMVETGPIPCDECEPEHSQLLAPCASLPWSRSSLCTRWSGTLACFVRCRPLSSSFTRGSVR